MLVANHVHSILRMPTIQHTIYEIQTACLLSTYYYVDLYKFTIVTPLLGQTYLIAYYKGPT